MTETAVRHDFETRSPDNETGCAAFRAGWFSFTRDEHADPGRRGAGRAGAVLRRQEVPMRSLSGAACLACVALAGCASVECTSCVALSQGRVLQDQFVESWDPHDVSDYEFFAFGAELVDPSGYVWESRDALKEGNADFWKAVRRYEESSGRSAGSPSAPQD